MSGEDAPAEMEGDRKRGGQNDSQRAEFAISAWPWRWRSSEQPVGLRLGPVSGAAGAPLKAIAQIGPVAGVLNEAIVHVLAIILGALALFTERCRDSSRRTARPLLDMALDVAILVRFKRYLASWLPGRSGARCSAGSRCGLCLASY